MLKNYLKIAFRSLWKNRMFTGINLLGLSLGLASAGVLILFTQRGITFDSFHKNNDQIYFVQTEGKDGRYNQTVYPILDQLVKTFPEVETGTHVQGWNNVWINYKGKDIQGDTKYVDTTFFDVFSFKLKYGNPKTALKKQESILLDENVAKALFGTKNPVGETVAVNDTINFTGQVFWIRFLLIHPFNLKYWFRLQIWKQIRILPKTRIGITPLQGYISN